MRVCWNSRAIWHIMAPCLSNWQVLESMMFITIFAWHRLLQMYWSMCCFRTSQEATAKSFCDEEVKKHATSRDKYKELPKIPYAFWRMARCPIWRMTIHIYTHMYIHVSLVLPICAWVAYDYSWYDITKVHKMSESCYSKALVSLASLVPGRDRNFDLKDGDRHCLPPSEQEGVHVILFIFV